MPLPRLALPPGLRGPLLSYVVVAGGLTQLPVLGILHAESSAVIAAVAYFAAGLGARRAFEQGRPLGAVLRAQLGALLLPWALLTLSLLWRPNCAYGQGLLFFLLFPVVTVVFAVSVAFAVHQRRLRRPRLALVLLGVALIIGGPLFDLGLHPQFYTYNHVFGGVLGPIYDEELSVRPGLFAFRGLTLLWALLAVLIGRAAGQPLHRRRGVVLTVLAIGLVYAFGPRLGLNTPAWLIQESLGDVVRTPHFDIYLDASTLTPAEQQRLAEDHEYRYAQLAATLQAEVPGRIASYIYPDPETKARLTGARTTNVAPVWLAQPQTHVLAPAYADVFPHELVHVFSRPFGLPVLNASLSVGLVEGFAVALEPPDGRPSPHEMVAVAAVQRARLTGEMDLAEDLASRLSPLGFWTGRGAVSYTTMGSFVRYLLSTYGPARLKAVYAEADFERVYGRPLTTLAAEWEAYVLSRPVLARSAEALVARRFSVPSLFERRCPHHVPAYRRAYRSALDALDPPAPDTAAALEALREALAAQPRYVPALDQWARLQLARGQAAGVAARLDTLARPLSPTLALRLGDAQVLLGDPREARASYEAAHQALPLYAQEERAYLLLRAALADQPAAVRVWVSPDSAAVQARRLAALPGLGEAGPWLEALKWAEADAPARAVELLRAAALPTGVAATPGRQAALARQRLAWMARFAYRAGALRQALTYATEAAEAFREVGGFNEAAALDDFADKLRWLRAHPPPTLDSEVRS